MESKKFQIPEKMIKKLKRQLIISLIIVMAAAAVRFFMPGTYENIADHFSNSVDFVSAFNAIGEGISGEQDIKDALSDACRYAFVGTDTDSFQASSID